MDSLPEELVSHILRQTSIDTIAIVSLVSKRFYRHALDLKASLRCSGVEPFQYDETWSTGPPIHCIYSTVFVQEYKLLKRTRGFRLRKCPIEDFHEMGSNEQMKATADCDRATLNRYTTGSNRLLAMGSQ